MLLKRAGEVQFARRRILGAEIEVVLRRKGFVRIQRSLNRRSRGITDRSGRQALIAIGVIGRIDRQIAVVQAHALDASNIFDSHVAPKSHIDLQPVMEHRGNAGKIRLFCFLFNQRSQGDHLIHGHAQRIRTVVPLIPEYGLGLRKQLFDYLLRRCRSIDFIGIGRQIAFQRINTLAKIGRRAHVGNVIVG